MVDLLCQEKIHGEVAEWTGRNVEISDFNRVSNIKNL